MLAPVHYMKERKMPGKTPKPLKEKILDGCIPEPNSGCWLWLKSTRYFGYGSVGIGSMTDGTRASVPAHRASFEAFVRPIRPGEVIRHKCDVPSCVNPDHLLAGTHADNVADKMLRGRHHYTKRTHCKNGHPFSSENTRKRTDGGRRCLTCERNHHT